MSYKAELADLKRDSERSPTEQIVAAIEGAIESGELTPGELRTDARAGWTAGINHLTAVRAYRRLRELGLVTSQVGRGTFVRDTAPLRPAGVDEDADGTEWQRYVLPAMSESHGDRVMAEMYRHSQARGLIPLSVGYPSSQLFPFEAMRKALGESLERRQPRPPVHRHRRPARPRRAARRALGAAGSARGPGRHHRHQRRPSGRSAGRARGAATGDAVACEAPTFMGVLESVKSIDARGPGPDGLRGLDLDALGSARARGDPLPRGPASLPQSDRSRSGAGAARAAAGAGPTPRLLHRRGRDLRGPALR